MLTLRLALRHQNIAAEATVRLKWRFAPALDQVVRNSHPHRYERHGRNLPGLSKTSETNEGKPEMLATLTRWAESKAMRKR
ncbi:MAG TPA: hypothetical protein DC054_24585 [Blastocatellia bacterium]|nr:hypothetical protein [Blastocatellia bacterium]